MKGIILAAGKGTRLYPMTKPVCKPLIPLYDKPLIYYPLTVLLQAKIRDILIIVPPGEERSFQALLGDGSQLGISISYRAQPVARGIADALLIGEAFAGREPVCLILGDNLFYQPELEQILKQAQGTREGAVIFGNWVEDPRPFGVVEFDEQGNVLSIEEKPENPKSNYIVPGLYFFDSQAIEIAKDLKPSARGELEITDVNAEYLRRKQLKVLTFPQDTVWFDAGNADSLFEAAAAVRVLQKETGRYLGCMEEQAWKNGFISDEQLYQLGASLEMTQYGKYLMNLTQKETR